MHTILFKTSVTATSAHGMSVHVAGVHQDVSAERMMLSDPALTGHTAACKMI